MTLTFYVKQLEKTLDFPSFELTQASGGWLGSKQQLQVSPLTFGSFYLDRCHN